MTDCACCQGRTDFNWFTDACDDVTPVPEDEEATARAAAQPDYTHDGIRRDKAIRVRHEPPAHARLPTIPQGEPVSRDVGGGQPLNGHQRDSAEARAVGR